MTASRSRRGLALATALALTATAFSVATSSAAEAEMAESITIYTPPGAAPNFDPAQASVNQYNFLAPVYDPLILRLSDGSYEPYLATEWSYTSPNEFTMTIRDGVTFADGTPLDAAAVVANIENVKNGTGSYAGQFAAMETVTATDPATVTITLSEPNPSLPVLFSSAAGMIASPSALGTDALATTPVGTGPYDYDAGASVENDTLVYRLRDDYWNPGHHHFQNVTLKIFQDETAAANAVVSGAADISEFGAPGPEMIVLNGGKELVGATYNVWGLGLLDRDGAIVPALAEPGVRKALNYAIDRPAIVDAVNQGLGSPTTQLVKTWMDGYSADLDAVYPYDPAMAESLLAEAGFADGFEFDAVSLSFFDQWSQAVAGYLADIGVTMNIVNVPPDQYIPSITGGTYPATVLPYGALDTYFDFGQLFAPDGGFNPFGTTDPTFDELYAAAGSATDDATLQDALTELNRWLVEDVAWWVPVNGDLFGHGYDPAKVQPAEWVGLRPLLLYDWLPGDQ